MKLCWLLVDRLTCEEELVDQETEDRRPALNMYILYTVSSPDVEVIPHKPTTHPFHSHLG